MLNDCVGILIIVDRVIQTRWNPEAEESKILPDVN